MDRARVRFEIHPPNIEEIYSDETPEEYVKRLATSKAKAVLQKTMSVVIVAADSIVVLNEEIIEKPVDKKNGIEILKKLQGKTHQFLTGICVINRKTNQLVTKKEITQVTFSPLSDDLIEHYIHKFQPFSYAGGYDNGISSWFIKSIKGSQSNLMGLPMTVLRSIIEDFGHNWFDYIK